MTQRRSNRISTFGSQLTSIVSVSLVLLILGVLAFTGIASRVGLDILKSDIGFIVKIDRSASDSDANRLKQVFNDAPYVGSYVYSSADEILASEAEYIGEDIMSLVDVNPFGAEFDVKVRPDYANADSIAAISAALASDPLISEVLTESTLIESVNSTLERLTLILAAIAIVLLVISVVLINNTVHLSVYSRRFVIHTMKLVGATSAFIRRPFICAGAVNGLISTAIASVLLVGGSIYASGVDPMLEAVFTPVRCGVVVAFIFVAGVLICTVASVFATNRYLRATYDDMFMK